MIENLLKNTSILEDLAQYVLIIGVLVFFEAFLIDTFKSKRYINLLPTILNLKRRRRPEFIIPTDKLKDFTYNNAVNTIDDIYSGKLLFDPKMHRVSAIAGIIKCENEYIIGKIKMAIFPIIIFFIFVFGFLIGFFQEFYFIESRKINLFESILIFLACSSVFSFLWFLLIYFFPFKRLKKLINNIMDCY